LLLLTSVLAFSLKNTKLEQIIDEINVSNDKKQTSITNFLSIPITLYYI
jgi:hypothetical protein